MKKFTFFDGCSEVMNNVGLFFGVFITELIMASITSVILAVPLGGFFSFLVLYFSMFLVPIASFYIYRDKTWSVKEVFSKMWEMGTKPTRGVANSLLKLLLVWFAAVLLFIMVAYSLISYIFISEMTTVVPTFYFTTFIYIMILFLVVGVVTTKMVTTLMFRVIDALAGVNYYEDHKDDYTFIFMYQFIPIVNIIADYAICVKYAHDICNQVLETVDNEETKESEVVEAEVVEETKEEK